ncbi:nectin-3-like protein isoform X3 [Alosa sapidissima]|uniref:nectin-3-like protein isoform X3 n=1 Tax=Alosa sapidissima TaxID=34773 RepID=UPI001C08F044|nr:nectin-3-like protein isoform X3 [Alosa sapidissima]
MELLLRRILSYRSELESSLGNMERRMSARYFRNNPYSGGNTTVVLLLLIASGVLCNQVLVPPRVSAVLGKNATLACRVEVDSNLSLTQSSWERRLPSGSVTLAVYNPRLGISVPPEYERRLSFHSPSPHDATIVLEDVSFADVGIYTCKVATFPLGNTQASTTVSVLVEPKVYVSAGSVALVDGGNETAVATCIAERARPPAEVSWETDLHGASEAQLQDEANGTTTTQVHYMWHPSRHGQGHTLTCVVRHPALQADFRVPYLVSVLFAPDIMVLGYDGDWFVGRENLQLTCQAKANPPAHHFRWVRLDGEMPEGVEMVNDSLVFRRPLQRNDSGVYRCEVGNNIGFRSRDLRIRVHDMSQEQRTSAMAVAGAIMGAILALFLITVFTIVLLTARKAPPPAYTDKVIDLPPTHKPPPPYSERRPSGIPARPVPPQVVTFKQVRQVADRRYEMAERPVIRTTQREMQSPVHQPLSYQEWVCHQNGADRVYINHREHYV